MYMSVIRRDERAAMINQNNVNEETVHQFIQELCGYRPRAEHNILYRRDGLDLCIYSDIYLDTDVLQKYGYYIINVIKIDELYNKIKSGDCLKIYVRTVPSTMKQREGKLSARWHFTKRYERVEWIEKKMQQIGAEVLYNNGEPLIIENGYTCLSFKHTSNQSTRGKNKFFAYDYIATVQVVDREKLKDGITKGIGPYKSYGCGLMLIGNA